MNVLGHVINGGTIPPDYFKSSLAYADDPFTTSGTVVIGISETSAVVYGERLDYDEKGAHLNRNAYGQTVYGNIEKTTNNTRFLKKHNLHRQEIEFPS